MFIEQPPLILRWLYPRAFWRMDKNEKAVYLTFEADTDWNKYLEEYARKIRNPLAVAIK
jgi:hypothetical protein